MKIAQVSTYDISGGAAIASHRLHQGMVALGQDSTLLVRWKASDDASVQSVSTQNTEVALNEPTWATIQQRYLNQNRTARSKTYFSFSYPGFDLSRLNSVTQADIINLHWVAAFQSPTTLAKLLTLGKPVVWTLHDMAPFTGGCHYTAGCNGFEQSCAQCPQLRDDPFALPAATLQDKLEQVSRFRNLTIVAPSRWLADCARHSRVFQQCRVEVIPYALNTELFAPIPKADAKRQLGIAPHTFTLVAQSTPEPRKGFADLLATLRQCAQHPDMAQLIARKAITLLIYGRPCPELEQFPIPHRHLGWKPTPADLIETYSAADVLVLPSFEDNLPNVMLEAMSCGTPVLAFDVGGMPDAIQHQQTGWLIPFGNFEQLGQQIIHCAINPAQCEAMQETCRQHMVLNYAAPLESKRYLELYSDLKCHAPPSPGVPAGTRPQKPMELAAMEEGVGSASDLGAIAPLDLSMGASVGQLYQSMLMHSLTQEADYYKQLAKQAQALAIELEAKQQRIAAMETSKFWLLRSRWFQLKRRLGLPVDE